MKHLVVFFQEKYYRRWLRQMRATLLDFIGLEKTRSNLNLHSFWVEWRHASHFNLQALNHQELLKRMEEMCMKLHTMAIFLAHFLFLLQTKLFFKNCQKKFIISESPKNVHLFSFNNSSIFLSTQGRSGFQSLYKEIVHKVVLHLGCDTRKHFLLLLTRKSM